MVERKRVTEKEYRAFLKERGLTRSFSTYQSIKGKRKEKIELSFSNFDGTSRREQAVLVRDKKGTQIREFRTLRLIGRSKSKDYNVVKKDLNEKKTKRITVRGKDFELKESKIKLKNTVAYSSYNENLNRTRINERGSSPPRKMGHVIAKIKAKKGSGNWKTQEAHSSGGYNLKDKKQVNQALDEAIGNCFAALEFTPDQWELIDWWYGSYYDVQGSGANVK